MLRSRHAGGRGCAWRSTVGGPHDRAAPREGARLRAAYDERAPRLGASDGAAVRLGDGAHDRQARGRTSRRGRPSPRTKRSKMRSRSSAGMPGPVVLDDEHARAPSSRADRGADVRAGRRVASAFSIRLSARRCSSSRDAVDDRAARRRRRARGRRRPARARRRPRRRPAPRSVGSCGRLAPGVGAREQQQVGDEPAHPLRGAQRAARRLALLAVEHVGEQLEVGQHAGQRRAQLVRGVGDELALARERGLGLRARRRRARGASRRACAASSATSSSAVGIGHAPRRGRACAAISRAVAVSAAIGAHRAAREPQAGEQRERGAAEHAEDQEAARTRSTVFSRSETRRRVLDDDRDRTRGSVERSVAWRVSTR